ncbi:hypothetical protein [Streptomyces sp. Ncost-T10-10d]|uniref:hypothetical protein n=1 Tax=Streptomyces sp. Ncost-T10-10d TaxID=1839774 RepID=UPI00081D6AF3|nr:hypothetical protein [Streptomyces sp. Ncost-T10-10d]SCF90666.1 hypothetical protein GA0115254_12419 [Streptomyces sp. Ncost-T10-10d]
MVPSSGNTMRLLSRALCAITLITLATLAHAVSLPAWQQPMSSHIGLEGRAVHTVTGDIDSAAPPAVGSAVPDSGGHGGGHGWRVGSTSIGKPKHSAELAGASSVMSHAVRRDTEADSGTARPAPATAAGAAGFSSGCALRC